MGRSKAGDSNLLFDLAQALTRAGERDAAVALRVLARAGYTSLEQASATSDWVLLAIPGLGEKRLAYVRRLAEQEWHPPSRASVEAMGWFMNAARFALRFWSPEALAARVLGRAPQAAGQISAEQRLALQMFAAAAAGAVLHCQAEELRQVLLQVGHGRQPHSTDGPESAANRQLRGREPEALTVQASQPEPSRETDHFAFPRGERFDIVRQYHEARRKGEVANKDQWAFANHNISGRTLSRYEREYLAEREDRP